MYDKLVAKVNNIDVSRFILKTKYDTDKSDLEKKNPDTSGLIEKTDYNAEISEIESKIPSITGLATNTALTAVEHKIPDAGSLVKKNQIITQKLVKLKKDLLIIIMTNVLLLQNLIRLQNKFLIRD